MVLEELPPTLDMESWGGHECKTPSLAGIHEIGKFARNDFTEGQVIITGQTSLVRVPVGSTDLVIETAVKRMEGGQKELDNLADNIYIFDAIGALAVLPVRRFKTNQLRVGDEMLVCPIVARVNHDCAPNAHYRWNSSWQRHEGVEIIANRDIKKGDEITISYIEPFIPFRQRRQLLASMYGFTCGCAVCDERTSEGRQSILRRNRIFVLWLFTHLHANHPGHEGIVEQHLGVAIGDVYTAYNVLLLLLHKEGIHAPFDEVICDKISELEDLESDPGVEPADLAYFYGTFDYSPDGYEDEQAKFNGFIRNILLDLKRLGIQENQLLMSQWPLPRVRRRTVVTKKATDTAEE